jgi:polyhydroxyalkanoate synthesis repressor PhaR
MPRLIKRYANRRLYDTERSRYITLDELANDIAEGVDVQVIDAQTGADLTRRTLLQCLLTDAHVDKVDVIPTEFLRTLIQLRDFSMLKLFEHYVNMTLNSFSAAREAMRQNMELFEKMAPGASGFMSMFAPWTKRDGGEGGR